MTASNIYLFRDVVEGIEIVTLCSLCILDLYFPYKWHTIYLDICVSIQMNTETDVGLYLCVE